MSFLGDLFAFSPPETAGLNSTGQLGADRSYGTGLNPPSGETPGGTGLRVPTPAREVGEEGGFNADTYQKASAFMSRAGDAFGREESRPIDIEYVDYEVAPDYFRGMADTPSSRTLKKKGGGRKQAIERGIRGEDAVDRNGVEIAAIQALTKRVKQLQKELDKRSASKGNKR